MRNKAILGQMLSKALLFIAFWVLLFVMVYSNYSSSISKNITIMSRYTFSVTVDSEGNVVNGGTAVSDYERSASFEKVSIEALSNIWIREFLNQFTQKHISRSRRLKDIEVGQCKILDEENDVVLIRFKAGINGTNIDNFAEWDGFLEEGKLSCEWVVTFNIENHYNGTATIYVESIVSPEMHGIEQNNKDDDAAKDTLEGTTQSAYAYYTIRNYSLNVTYDGGSRYSVVPVDVSNLPMVESDDQANSALKNGTYIVNTTTTAFLYGGRQNGSNRVPLTILFSNDMGTSWTTSQIDDIYGAQFYYMEFFDEKNGVVVAEYETSSTQQFSKIYKTEDGGNTWSNIGTGPSTGKLKGVKYISPQVGFFSYKYEEGNDSNLYMTSDGAKAFAKVYLPKQRLEQSIADEVVKNVYGVTEATSGVTEETTAAISVTWSDVFKEANAPVLDKNDALIVYLTQGDMPVYNEGKTVARYVSNDNGVTFRYSGLVELTQ